MRHTKILVLLAIASLFVMGTAIAQEDPANDRQQMSAEERQAAREARRAEWENMSEEERAAARAQREEAGQERRAATRERMENMSDEERQAARDRMKKRADQRPSGDRNNRSGQGQRGRRNGPGKT
jgi:hypothetical protein